MLNIKRKVSIWFHVFKNKYLAPLIRRKKSEAVKARYMALASLIGCPQQDPYAIPIYSLQEPQKNLAGQEVCLFVSYSSVPQIKPHVAHHLRHLIAAGLSVILIINTDQPEQDLYVEKCWKNLLSGLYVRKNVGLDFAAWSQVFSMQTDSDQWKNLYLINDSIVGPVSADGFNKMIEKIRDSQSDLIGLISSSDPRYHLQSFFLVLGQKLLLDTRFRKYFSEMLVLPDKQLVIDIYETQLTKFVQCLQFSAESIYSLPPQKSHKFNDTIHRWEALLHIGFPYVKASVIKNFPKKQGTVSVGKITLDRTSYEITEST